MMKRREPGCVEGWKKMAWDQKYIVECRKNISAKIVKWLSSDHSLDLVLIAPKLK